MFDEMSRLGPKSRVTRDEMREVWALVTEQPGISLRSIASELNITFSRAKTIVNWLLKSGTLTKGSGKVHKTLRATVPLLTIRE